MVRLTVLSGSKAGTAMIAGHFPFRIGRSSKANLCLEDPGVWNQHLELSLKLPEGFVLTLQENALASVNQQPCRQVCLHNGDLIQIGSVKMQFTLSDTVQYSFCARELLTWAGLGLLFAGQAYLICWLLR
jgi:pSer/pThr/pTyr-binding forkhead associated (FHA) protein